MPEGRVVFKYYPGCKTEDTGNTIEWAKRAGSLGSA